MDNHKIMMPIASILFGVAVFFAGCVPNIGYAAFQSRELMAFAAGELDAGHLPVKKQGDIYVGISGFKVSKDGQVYVYDSKSGKALEINPRTLAARIISVQLLTEAERAGSTMRLDDIDDEIYFVSGNLKKIEIQSTKSGKAAVVEVSDPRRLASIGSHRWRFKKGTLVGNRDAVGVRKKQLSSAERSEAIEEPKKPELMFYLEPKSKESLVQIENLEKACQPQKLGTKKLFKVDGPMSSTEKGKAYFCKVLDQSLTFDPELRNGDSTYLYINLESCGVDFVFARSGPSKDTRSFFAVGPQSNLLELLLGAEGAKLIEWTRK